MEQEKKLTLESVLSALAIRCYKNHQDVIRSENALGRAISASNEAIKNADEATTDKDRKMWLKSKREWRKSINMWTDINKADMARQRELMILCFDMGISYFTMVARGEKEGGDQ